MTQSKSRCKTTNRKTRTKTKKPVVAASGAPIIEGMAEVMTEKPTSDQRKLAAFYAKYSHVKAGSVREPNTEEIRNLTKCHGKICTVICEDCREERTINTQDAFQVTRCNKCQARRTRQIRKESRKRRLAHRAEIRASQAD